MLRPKFSAVLFDCDGVLVDSEPVVNAVLKDMLTELGWNLSQEECIRIFIGKALKDQWEPIFKHTGVRIDDQWIAEFRARRDVALRENLQAVPGSFTAVQQLASIYDNSIACATGADRAKVEMQLALSELAPFFGKRVFSGLECERSKPAPDVYLAAADALQIDPRTALVIEDTATGVRAGVAAGATVYAYSSGGPTSTSPEELRESGAALVFTKMEEVIALASVAESILS